MGQQIRIRLPQDDTPISGRVAWQLGTAEGGQSIGVKVSGAELSWFIAVGDGDADSTVTKPDGKTAK